VDLLLVATGAVDDVVAAVDGRCGDVRGRDIGLRIAVAIEPGGFDALVSLGGDECGFDELTDRLCELTGDLDGLVDAQRSAAIAGRVQVVLDGDGPVFAHYPLRRLPHLTIEAFQAHWSSTHADLARAVPGLAGYRQFHADIDATVAAAAAVGVGVTDFEGAAEGRRLSRDAPPLAPGPQLEAVLADERRFIDVTRCRRTLYEAVSGASTFRG